MRYSHEVTLEFLVETIAKNLQYIFLVLQSLNLLKIINFNLNPSHFPGLSIQSEIGKIVGYTYNPIFIYGHYLYVFFLVAKGFALGFFETIKNNWIPALVACLLIVNIWFLYSRVSYKKTDVLSKLAKSTWATSDILERGLWAMFFIDIMSFITTPDKIDILFLIIIYALMISIRYIPLLSEFLIIITEKLEKTILYNKKLLLAVTVIDIALVYFDTQSMFTLFLIILLYNLIAYLVLKLLKNAGEIREYAFYLFNFGILIFFFSIIAIYWIAFAAVLLIQSPIIGFYYYKYKKFISRNIMEIINGVILAVLLYILWF